MKDTSSVCWVFERRRAFASKLGATVIVVAHAIVIVIFVAFGKPSDSKSSSED